MIAVAALLFVVLFWRLGAASFWDPDEAHYAETTRELLVSGDWWAPYYNEQPFFDKPIFFHQLQAISMLVAGENELGARLVPALAALALVLFTGWLGVTLMSFDVGLVAALLLALNPGTFALARYAILDTLFTALLFGGAGLLAVAALAPETLDRVGSGSSRIGSRQAGSRRRLQWPGYILIAGAVMTKGPLAFVLCGLTMGLAMAVSADVRRRLLALHWLTGLGIAVAISAPWFVYMYLRFRGDFVGGYLLDENIRLFATDRFGDQPPFWFYFRIVATGMLPWTGRRDWPAGGRCAGGRDSSGTRRSRHCRRDAVGLDVRDRRLLHVIEIQARSLHFSRRAGTLSSDCERMERHPRVP